VRVGEDGLDARPTLHRCDEVDGRAVRRTLPNLRTFQTATGMVSSSFDGGILAAAIRFLSASRP